ncbi:threonine ammonia-lyase IlvA [Aestuariimicrobium sp. T2.26MG-19.2B]|uniref:threonine ammonia-lyase IlvA n=1 Tax=Aestuariimicrobium sp. T2.26MG-19.2B TaxID=3040679 RepID=UPI0025425B50|nr:threonine ammonia-lyase IlvA [Aestuariimicrobium sp. T2.26MG-19.2B]
MTSEDVTLARLAEQIEAAQECLRGVTLLTPLQPNERLSAQAGATVLLKREDLQPVRSYKLRGAYNLISQLTAEERAHGVVCASAGNHGQGVAWSCAELGIDARIFVPGTTPRQKRDRMWELGRGRVTLVVGGETYDEAAMASRAHARETGAIPVPAFNDPRTIAGQGTVGPEIVEQLGDAPDVLLVPVGGGGMLSGCLAWFRTHHPRTRVVGVEPAGAACMSAALAAGRPVTLAHIDTFADGAAVSRAGELTHRLVAEGKSELVVVPEGQICSEMLDLYQSDGIIAEPAGALASSAIKTHARDADFTIEPGSTVVAILSGGNNDVSRYAEIVERSLIHEGRKHYFLVQFPQEPGALRRFLDEVLGPEDDIAHFEYVKRSNRDVGPALVGIELGDPYSYPVLIERLNRGPVEYEVVPPDSALHRYLI